MKGDWEYLAYLDGQKQKGYKCSDFWTTLSEQVLKQKLEVSEF